MNTNKISFLCLIFVVLSACNNQESNSNVKDLSSAGTANCYIVNAEGKYKFKADVKGNSSDPLDGIPIKADVLWESFGSEIVPYTGDVISSVSYSNGYVRFSTASPFQNGNAVIAVKNTSGEILWSWHIWVYAGFDPEATAQVYFNNAGVMMDRNLGATSNLSYDVKSLGLMYEWGRKDPFLGPVSFSGTSYPAASTIKWPDWVMSDKTTGTIAYTVSHPTTFVSRNRNNSDWFYTDSTFTDNTRWQTSDKCKGVYDPCPVGWRVPDGGPEGIWNIALCHSDSGTDTLNPWVRNSGGLDLGYKLGHSNKIWYPYAGHRATDEIYDAGKIGHYWSSTPTPDGCLAYTLDFCFDDFDPVGKMGIRGFAISVRCMKE